MNIETSESTQEASFSCAGSTETNQSISFSSLEDADLEAAREAWFGLKRSFEGWMAVGKGIRILRQRADRLGGRNTFARLMAEQGFRMDGRKGERQFDKSTVTRLLQVMRHEPEVSAWHRGLPPLQQIAWASPDAIIRHCPTFRRRSDGETKPSPYEQLRRANIQLQEENYRLKRTQDGDTWSVKDKDRDIALAMIGQLEGYKGKAERVFREGAAILYERRRKNRPDGLIDPSKSADPKGDLGSMLKSLIDYMNDRGISDKDLPKVLDAGFDDLDLTELSKRLHDLAGCWKAHKRRIAKTSATSAASRRDPAPAAGGAKAGSNGAPVAGEH
jgi:hypothetical protein